MEESQVVETKHVNRHEMQLSQHWVVCRASSYSCALHAICFLQLLPSPYHLYDTPPTHLPDVITTTWQRVMYVGLSSSIFLSKTFHLYTWPQNFPQNSFSGKVFCSVPPGFIILNICLFSLLEKLCEIFLCLKYDLMLLLKSAYSYELYLAVQITTEPITGQTSSQVSHLNIVYFTRLSKCAQLQFNFHEGNAT